MVDSGSRRRMSSQKACRRGLACGDQSRFSQGSVGLGGVADIEGRLTVSRYSCVSV